MPNTVPVRGLGSVGIVSDIRPYDLPSESIFSAGVNVRFENGTVSRGPISRLVLEYPDTFAPVYIFSIPQPAGGPETFVSVSHDYTQFRSDFGETTADITPTGGTTAGSVSDHPISHCFLGGLVYLNHRSNVPFQLIDNTSSKFTALSGWDSTWRCEILRPYKDVLVAFNVSKGSIDYPSMVKWSDITSYGSPPPSWDATLTTNSAGENILNQMRGPIVDAAELRDTMVIYGANEVWSMNYVGGTFLYDFRKTFDDIGVLSANCVVEVDGQHYVFDRNDIIAHDGSNKRSIIHGRNKDFVFNGLVRDLAYLSFVIHNPRLNEIHFCYPSNDSLVGFANPSTGCNRAAVYNYRRDTWTFYDLPNVTFGCLGIVSTSITYAEADPLTYDTTGGFYSDGSSDNEFHQLLTSQADATQGITKNRIIGLDLMFNGRLPKPLLTEVLKDAFAERIGIDLDQSGVSIAAYKSLLKIYPQIAVYGPATGVTFQFGANDTSSVSPAWDTPTSFDPSTDYQIDVREAGRYLAHRVRVSGLTDFDYSGFDAALVIRGKR